MVRPRLYTEEESRLRNIERNRILVNAKTSAKQEIGELPEVVDPVRKAECGESLELFGMTYFTSIFYLPFSSMHRDVIKEFETVIRNGGLRALAMPRGSGKTALVRVASIWAILYGYISYVYFIGASSKTAKKSLDAIKAFVYSDLLLEDFPEAIFPLRRLKRQPKACAGQTYQGESTLSQWSKDALVFPTIPGSKASGAVFNVDGITSAFRGADFTHPGGKMLRPQLVIPDDPQTDKSAKSEGMCEDREALISGTMLGLAGPDVRIASIMPCTVIRVGDLSDRMLNTKLHPEWNGLRFGMVKSFPTDESKWAKYKEILVNFNSEMPDDSARAEKEATQYYRDNQEEMKAGSELTWPARFSPECVDALQYAMNLQIRDDKSFWSEYQNQPVPPKSETISLIKPFDIAAKLSGYARGIVPVDTTKLVAAIDVQQNLLYYTIAAYNDDFTGFVVDYGTFPEQTLPYFTYTQVQKTISKVLAVEGVDGQIYAALTALTTILLTREFPWGSGGVRRIEKCIIDAGWKSDLIYKFCRQSQYSAMLSPSHGKYIGANGAPMNQWKGQPGEKRGLNWFYKMANNRAIRYLLFDTNYWKTFLHGRLNTAMGNPGALSLFGKTKEDSMGHRMFTDHLVAEKPKRVVSNSGRELEEWDNPFHKDNHWFDTTILTLLAASMQGASLPELQGKGLGGPKKGKVVSFKEQQDERQREKGQMEEWTRGLPGYG